MFPKSLIVFSLITVSNVLAIPKASWIRRQEDAQKSLTLDPAVISHGLEQDGQGDNPDPGQVRSLTSSNNFINFCLPFLDKGVPLTDGQQIVTGSCNPTPIGRIISLDLAPRCKFVFPKNGDESIVANQPFTVKLKLKNLQTGNFVNAQTNYYAAPQQVNGQGIVKGHSHVVIEELQSLKSAEPLDPTLFKFFKGLNDVAKDDILTADVTAGLPAGVYRICSINTAANHQPCLVSNAQHGSLDDCVYFTVKNPGEANNDNKNNDNKNDNKNNETATAAATNTETSTAATETASDAAETGKNDNKDANETGKDDNKDANETGNASQTETGATETASETGKDANETGAPEASNTETADQGNETAPPENNDQASSTETAADGNQTAAPENNEQGGKNDQGGDDQQDGKDQQQQGSDNNEQPPANQDQAPVNQDQQQPPSQDQQQQPPAQDQQQQAPPTDQAPANNQQQQGQGQQDQGGRGRNGQDGQQQPQGQDGKGNRDGGRGRNN